MKPYKSLTEAELIRVARIWQKRLKLDTWDIEFLVDDLKPKSTAGRCWTSDQYDTGTIKFARWILENEPPKSWRRGRKMTLADVERVIVHELLHCHIMPLDRWRKHLAGRVKPRDLAMACLVYDDQEEAIVDRLARALTSCVPPVMVTE